MINKHIYTTLFIKQTVRYKLLVSTIAQKLILLNQQTRRVYSAVKVDISEWYPSCQLLMIRSWFDGSCVVFVDRLHMHAIIKTSNVLIKKKKRTEKQRTTM